MERQREREKEEDVDVCNLVPSKGDCEDYEVMWYFSAARSRCERFRYGGCGGNGNRFQSQQACEAECLEERDRVRPTPRPRPRPRPRPQTTTVTTTTQATPTTSSVVGSAACNLPSDRGDYCGKWEIYYYYNSTNQRCRRFYYGGCAGNGNRFANEEECKATCMSAPAATEAPRPVDCIRSRYGCCRDGVTTAIDLQRSNCPEAVTEAPRRVPCARSAYGCCNDGVTTAVDWQRSNCDESNVVIRPGNRGERRIMVRPGSTSRITCTLRGQEFMWYHDSLKLESSGRYYIYTDGTLELRDITEDMAGSYSCSVWGSNQERQFERFRVDMNVPLAMIPGPVQVTVRPRRTAYLYCQATGSPAPTITWSRDGRPIQTYSRYSVFNNGTLIVRDVEESDVGEFVCTANNGVASPVQREIKLKIEESLEANILGHRAKYHEGDTAKLICVASGFPAPTVEWIRDNKPMYTNGNIVVNGATLIINQLTVHDAGPYSCIATNRNGRDADRTTIRISTDRKTGEECRDTIGAAVCKRIKRGRLCGLKTFQKRCCMTCT